MPKPTYVVQSVVKKKLAIPKTNIKAPNTICALANPRKAVALYTMTVIKLVRNRTFDHTPKNSRLQCLGLANVTLPWLGWGI